MANAKFKYIDGSGNIVNYTCPVNFYYIFRDTPDIDRRVRTTVNNIISKTDIYGRHIFDREFKLITTAQKEEFEAINSAGLVWFYPEGGTAPVYYGLVKFENFVWHNTYWNCNMNFIESSELTSEFSFITVKMVNNDSLAYGARAWKISGINTTWLIANKGLASDCHNLKIRDGTGAFYDYYVVPGTWNTSNTTFWIKKGSVDIYETVFFQFVLNDNYNYVQDGDLVFTQHDDMEAYALASTLPGQGGWLNGYDNGEQEIALIGSRKHLSISSTSSNTTSIYHPFVFTGSDEIIAYWKFDDQGNSGYLYFSFHDGDISNSSYPGIAKEGYEGCWHVATAGGTTNRRIFKTVASVRTELANNSFVSFGSEYTESIFRWQKTNLTMIEKLGDLTISDSVYGSEDYFGIGVRFPGSGAARFYIDFIAINPGLITDPTITIYGQP